MASTVRYVTIQGWTKLPPWWRAQRETSVTVAQFESLISDFEIDFDLSVVSKMRNFTLQASLFEAMSSLLFVVTISFFSFLDKFLSLWEFSW